MKTRQGIGVNPIFFITFDGKERKLIRELLIQIVKDLEVNDSPIKFGDWTRFRDIRVEGWNYIRDGEELIFPVSISHNFHLGGEEGGFQRVRLGALWSNNRVNILVRKAEILALFRDEKLKKLLK